MVYPGRRFDQGCVPVRIAVCGYFTATLVSCTAVQATLTSTPTTTPISSYPPPHSLDLRARRLSDAFDRALAYDVYICLLLAHTQLKSILASHPPPLLYAVSLPGVS